MVVLSEPSELLEPRRNTARAPAAVAVMLGMLVLMTFGIVANVTAVLIAAVAMVVSGCLDMDEAYRSINLESVVLIAAILPMATALSNTGGMDLIVARLLSGLGDYGPFVMMSGLFVLTSVFSQVISNTATTILVAPVALQTALTLGVSPESFLMTVAIAASTAFATPIASPVNTLVLNPGGYRFGDFLRVGLLMQFVIMVATLLSVPFFFPF
jgi:di/tricarboxylate transporter